MAIKLVTPSARRREVPYKKTASNAQAEYALGYLTSNAVTQCSSASTAGVIAGLVIRPTAATDSDYASNTVLPYLVDEDGIYSIPVGTSTNFAIGLLCDGSSTGQTLDCANTTYKTFCVVGGDTTTALVTIRRWAHNDPGASVT
jgi:hypothetical protein